MKPALLICRRLAEFGVQMHCAARDVEGLGPVGKALLELPPLPGPGRPRLMVEMFLEKKMLRRGPGRAEAASAVVRRLALTLL